MSEEIPLSYSRAVGDRLRALRRQRGLSLLAVEESSDREFKASVLGAYERGERVISVLRLQRLAQFYRVPVDQILPRYSTNGSGGGPASEEFIPKRPLTIDLEKLDQTDAIEGQVVRRYVHSIQSQRAGFHGTAISIRGDDLRVMAMLLERDERSLEMRLVDLGLRY